MSSKLELSVVVIGRNEAANIHRCLESILDATKGFQSEIIYVDSNSTDGTVESASKYNVTILVLRPEWVLSAAAGRYIGTINSNSDYILFCDCDVHVRKKWLFEALAYIKSHPDVGGVGGFLIDCFTDNTKHEVVPILRLLAKSKDKALPCKSLAGGVTIYRRKVLEQAGHFNPYLYAEEEWDLGHRIRGLDFELIILTGFAGDHYTVKRLSFKGLFKRTKIYDCYGQLIRLGKDREGFWKEFLAGPIRYILFYNAITVLLVSIAFINVVIDTNIWWIASPLILLFMVVVFFSIRRKTIFAFPLFIIRSLFTLWCTIIVLLNYEPKTAVDYPTDVKVIKTQSR